MPEVHEAERQLLHVLLGRVSGEEASSASQIDPQASADFLAAILAVLVRKRLGDAASLETIAGYSREMIATSDQIERPMLVESVLRTGAGYPNMLIGVDQDDVVRALALCTRHLFEEVGAGDPTFESSLIASAVRARQAGTYGVATRSDEG